MNNSPPFKRHSVGRTYPWQVAPQQSLLPFRFNNTKFKSVNYIYNLSKFPATFTCPLMTKVATKNEPWGNHSPPHVFLGAVIACGFYSPFGMFFCLQYSSISVSLSK